MRRTAPRFTYFNPRFNTFYPRFSYFSSSKMLSSLPNNMEEDVCKLCRSSENDLVNLGRKYLLGTYPLHYFCVRFATHLASLPAKSKEMRGVNLSDVRETLQICMFKECSFCQQLGATIRCAGVNETCPVQFHLPCGLKNNTVSIFGGGFKSFCNTHRPRQNIPARYAEEAKMNPPLCVICQEHIDMTKIQEEGKELFLNEFWAPCCKSAWYHRHCVQELAVRSKNLLKCSVCCNYNTFLDAMRNFGVTILSDYDDSFDFVYLPEMSKSCNWAVCQCPFGRENEDSDWKILRCRSCGIISAHLQCAGLAPYTSDWECTLCELIGRTSVTEVELAEVADSFVTTSDIRRMRPRIRHRNTKEFYHFFSIDFSNRCNHFSIGRQALAALGDWRLLDDAFITMQSRNPTGNRYHFPALEGAHSSDVFEDELTQDAPDEAGSTHDAPVDDNSTQDSPRDDESTPGALFVDDTSRTAVAEDDLNLSEDDSEEAPALVAPVSYDPEREESE